MKMAVVLLQQLVLRNTVYVCGKYVYGYSWMCGLTAIPLDKSQVCLMFLLGFSYALFSRRWQLIPVVKMMGLIFVVSLK